MKQRVIARLLAVSLLVVPALQLSSCTVDTAPAAVQAGSTSYYILRDKTGEIIDYNLPVPLESIESRAEDGTYLNKTSIQTGSISRFDCGYHPQSSIWSNPARYYFTENETVPIRFELGLTSEIKCDISMNVSAAGSSDPDAIRSYQADQTRQSKIRVYGDFDYTVYKAEVRSSDTDEILYTFEVAEVEKTGEFFEVVYKT